MTKLYFYIINTKKKQKKNKMDVFMFLWWGKLRCKQYW